MSVRRLLTFALPLLALLACPGPAPAQPADQTAIDRAIESGVQYLKQSQKPGGNWGEGTGPGSGKGWGVGFTALAGLALYESGTPATDSALLKAANVVRLNANELDDTYEVALAILFLDRMKARGDKTLIQALAGRLIAAQMPSGGWGYKVKKQTSLDMTQLLTALRRMTPPPTPIYPSARERPSRLGLCIKAVDDIRVRPPALTFDPVKARNAAMSQVPLALRRLPVLAEETAGLPDDPKDKGSDLTDATTDNSNTHFAMIGLWAARKYDVPTDRTFALVAKRFRMSQGPNGTWGYGFARGGANGGAATTCVALLGVAIGYVVSPDPNVRPERDPLLLKAFAALGNTVGAPAGTTANRPKVKDVGGLYFMWAMERIAVLYDVRKLNNKDWYLWGAEILIGNQAPDGSWEEGGFPGQHAVINTALAVLFLKRANLTPDLSRRLVADTGAIAAKVDDRPPPPKVEPPAPKVEPPPKTVEPPKAPEPKKEPPAPAPEPTPAPTPAPEQPTPVTTTAPEKKTPWLMIVLGMILAGATGGGLAFLAVKKMKKDGDEDAEEKPKKKKGKKKLKPKVDDE